MGLYDFGRTVGQLPQQAGALARSAFGLPRRFANAAQDFGQNVRYGAEDIADEFSRGLMGAPQEIGGDINLPPDMSPPTTMVSRDQAFGEFEDVDSGASSYQSPIGQALNPPPTVTPRGALMSRFEGAMPGFGDVESGASNADDPNAHVMRTLSGPRSEPESYLRVGMGGGPLQDYTPRGPDIGASGRGTVSMMTAPENVGVVTRASQLEDAQAEAELRAARGEPSPGDIFRYQQQQALKYGPDERLKMQQANDTRQELSGWLQFQQDVKEAVDSGQMSPQDAEARLSKAREDMALRINALNGQSVGPWGPKPNSFQLPIG